MTHGAPADPALDSFCRPELASLSLDARPWPYVRADFHLEHYSPSLYRQAGVRMPAPVARSVPKRQAEYLAGRLCAHRVMEHWRCPGELVPGAAGRPHWPPGLRGSLSHSSRHAVALARPADDCAGVGIDTELVAGGRASEALLRYAIRADEHAWLDTLSAGIGRDAAIVAVFSAKESFFKAAFEQVGTHFGFEALALRGVCLASRRLRFAVMRTLAPRLRVGGAVSIGFDLPAPGQVLTCVALGTATM